MSAVVVNLNGKIGRNRLSRPWVRANCLTINRSVCSAVIKLERESADIAQIERQNLELAGERQGAILAINLNFGLNTVDTSIGRNFFQRLALAIAPVRKLVILRPGNTYASRRDDIVSSVAVLIRHRQRWSDFTAAVCNAQFSLVRRCPIDTQLDGIAIFVAAIARAHLAGAGNLQLI